MPHHKYKILTLFTLLSLISFYAVAQQIEKTYIIGELVINSKDNADPENFHTDILESIIFDEINSILQKKGYEPKQKDILLTHAAKDQAEYMALTENDDVVRESKEKATTGDRIASYGGSHNGAELCAKTSVKSGKIPYTYAKIADDIVFRWFTNTRKAKLLEGYEYNLIGISAKLDERKRKVYVSVVLGNYKSYNEGRKFVSNLTVPYSTKTYGLTPTNPIFCKRIERYNPALIELQKSLYVEDDIIYLETNDIKTLKRIINKKKDGLAVDILQKEQFSCENPNIIDYDLINTGILTKRLYSKKLYKNNLANIEENPKSFKTALAVLPEGIDNNYELNLVVIKNKSVCKSISQNFIIETEGNYTRNVKLLADTVTINTRFQYTPIPDSMELSVRIPFDKKKYTFNTEDIEPFLKLINDPTFIIYDMKIVAYSSIEGSDEENKILQQKRAESIINALSGRQKSTIKTTIETKDNWDDFKRDVKNTNHNIMASMTPEEARQYIKQYNLSKELEPILSKHRYAQIEMKVTYDISGDNEIPYVLKEFDRAISEQDRILALSIEKYIMKQILNYRYKPEIINKLNIPEESQYAGLLMNQAWLKYHTKQINESEFAKIVDDLHSLNDDNEYIAFNNCYLQVFSNKSFTESDASLLQTEVNRLYYTPLSKKTVDGLNIKLQFKIINYADSVSGSDKLKQQCIENIKNIVDINEETLQNSLKLASLFMENRDYTFALKTLEPWITDPGATENLLLTYVSLCSRYDARMHTQKFNYAMNRIKELNPKEFCNLLNGSYFSLKVLENKDIKEMKCKYCETNKMVLE